jgi:D-alanine-D-alanine ligase
MKSRRLRVGVLFGGKSAEHDVSLASARSLIGVLDPEKYDVVPIAIARSGQWVLQPDRAAALLKGGLAGSADEGLPDTGRDLVPGATGAQMPHLDVIFPVLHGTYGEDGTVQGLLELAGVPYVGCGVLASSLAMDKIVSKDVFRAQGLPVVAFRACRRHTWEENPDAVLDEIEAGLAYPVFVKPANLGSSVGISKARNREELVQALAEAARYDRKILVEQGVPFAREIECSVLGNDEPRASIPGEVVPSNEFYDYAAKYINGRSELIIPAPLSPQMQSRVRELAVLAYKALDGAGLARVDFLLNGETGELYLNEINTLPGFTTISMYPKLWEATGVSYSELIDLLIDYALERHGEKTRSQTTFEGGELTA